MAMEWGEISLYLTTKGEVIVWTGEEAEVCGSLMDLYGRWDDNEVGEAHTGRIGLFAFEVLDYDRNRDMFRVKRLSE